MTERAIITPDEAREKLFAAAKVKVPSFRPEGDQPAPHAQQKINLLEDYLMLAARWRASLEEARLHMDTAVKRLEDEWDEIEGWEMTRDPNDKTQRAVTNAKRKLRPDLYDGIREGKWIADKLARQVKRFEKDEEIASRAYTLITGG